MLWILLLEGIIARLALASSSCVWLKGVWLKLPNLFPNRFLASSILHLETIDLGGNAPPQHLFTLYIRLHPQLSKSNVSLHSTKNTNNTNKHIPTPLRYRLTTAQIPLFPSIHPPISSIHTHTITRHHSDGYRFSDGPIEPTIDKRAIF